MRYDDLIAELISFDFMTLSNLLVVTFFKTIPGLSATKPRLEISIVCIFRMKFLNWCFKFIFRLDLYFSILNSFDLIKLVSWQTVSSSVSIELLWIIAMSGRSDSNISEMDNIPGRFKSAYIVVFGSTCIWSHSVSIVKILSCLFVYRSRAAIELQLAKTCLFVWVWLHSGHSASFLFPHLYKFEFVGSCCWSAFRVNL